MHPLIQSTENGFAASCNLLRSYEDKEEQKRGAQGLSLSLLLATRILNEILVYRRSLRVGSSISMLHYHRESNRHSKYAI